MKTYIALLRGINVSGQKKIKMADLREQLAELKWQNIQTYIQSGNVVFETKATDIPKLEAQLKAKIEEHYGFEVPIVIKTAEELEYAMANNPYLKDRDPAQSAFTFLKEEPEQANIEKLASYTYPNEEYTLDGKCLYYFTTESFGRAKMSNNFFENKLKVGATTRNVRTVNVLIEMAKGTK